MAIVPIRNLGQLGVNTDVDPLDLPLTAFSYAANVRFTDNKISRSPVFAKIGHTTSNATPRWAYSYRLQGSSAVYLVMSTNGTVFSLSATSPGSTLTYTDKSIAGYVPSTQTYPFTSTMLANVVYINREDRVPWHMIPSASQFSALGGEWDSGWRCKSLRAFNGALVALNVTKGATSYPTMIKTSDFAAYATAVTTWIGTTSNSATENVLTDLVEPIVDGYPLRDKFMIYSANETWQMVSTGDNDIYRYYRMFSAYGAIAPNCVAEVNNTHFVFGENDLWQHDGYSPKSLASGRVRKYVFDHLIRAEKDQFFVVHNPKLTEVMFCYLSDDPYAAFPVGGNYGYPGCNKAAVYNYQFDTWYFYDLPYVNGGGLGEMYSGLTYADMGSVSYESTSATYLGLTDTSRLFTMMVGRPVSLATGVLPLQSTGSNTASATHLYSFETLENTVGIGTLVDVTNAPSFLENIQMDMDEISKEIRTYKVILSVYPQGRVESSSYPLSFWSSATDYSGESPHWTDDTLQTFDGNSYYKLDFRYPGRYLSWRMAMGNPPQQFSLSGMDIDYKTIAHR